ncbi:MAG: DUF348 domain-containing protein, partial [Selenomonadaceae bacterium]|nr:DUF348 domain-containing protein [Selenomonadaceae bacterium]
GRVIDTHTTTVTPERILRHEGISLGDHDEYRLRKVNNQTEITVYRAVPVTIEVEGKKREVMTSKPTVEEALLDLGYDLEDYDVTPGLESTIHENIDITLTARPARIAEEEAEAEAELQYAEPMEASVDGFGSYSDAMIMEATAYLPTDGSPEGLTASGIPAQRGIAAVDPDVIPLGTRLYIPGYGEALAADTGGAIIGNKIDLCMEDYGECMEFGRRDITVYVLD